MKAYEGTQKLDYAADRNRGVNDAAGALEVMTRRVGDPESGITQICCMDMELMLFENQYPVIDGMTYNTYFIDCEQPTVVDSVDDRATGPWLDVLARLLAGRKPAYMIVQHLEPDHAGSLEAFCTQYPECRIVCTAKAAAMFPNFMPCPESLEIQQVKEGDVLSVGRHELHFIMAPMVHWPEVMVTYDSTCRVLFSADAFGTFGCSIVREIMLDEAARHDALQRWAPEAARYYFNICGKYGGPVQQLLRKVSCCDVAEICPLHGPTIVRDILKAEELYDRWSRGDSDYPDGVFIAVGTLHGNTYAAAEYLKECLVEHGVGNVKVADLSRADISQCVSDAFQYGSTVFASSTYDASLVPAMADLVEHLGVKGWNARKAAIVENGSWAPAAARLLRARLEAMKNIDIIEPVVSIRTKMNAASRKELAALAANISEAIKA